MGSEPAPTSPPVLDVEEGLRHLHTPKIFRKLLGRFAQNYARYAEDIAAYIASGEIPEAAKQTHKLKGVAGTLGLMEISSIILELDAALVRQDSAPNTLESLVASLRLALDRSLAEIHGYLTESEPAPPPFVPDNMPRSAFSETINVDLPVIKQLLQAVLKCLAENDLYCTEPLLAELTAKLPAMSLNSVQERLEEFDFRGAETRVAIIADRLKITL